MRSLKKIFLIGAALAGLAAFTPQPSCAQDVRVFAEGAYTAGDLAVYVYANISNVSLCSFGVKLTYDQSKLSDPQAVINSEVWSLKDRNGAVYPYLAPQVNTAVTPAEIVFIGGKYDAAAAPAAGAAGQRVLLGKVLFNRSETSLPVALPETYFKIAVSRGKEGDFSNFVTTSGAVQDKAVAFGVNKVRERGDADASGRIDVRDIAAIKLLLQGQSYPVYADCDASESMDVRDIACLKLKLR